MDDAPGTIRFDPSFNRGGDTITLHGASSAWTAAIQGSSAILSDGDTTAIIPVGTAGITLDFADGMTGTLAFDQSAGSVMLGGRALGEDAAPLAISPPAGSFAIMAPESGATAVIEDWPAASGWITLG